MLLCCRVFYSQLAEVQQRNFCPGTKQEQSASTAGHLSANSMNGQESDFWSEPSPGNLLSSERELFCPSICPAGCQKIGKETIFPTCVNEIANLPEEKLT